MNSSHSSRRGRTLSIGLASAITGVLLAAVPAAAEEPDAPDCTDADAELQEASESDALDLAFACETEVLIEDSFDYTSRSFAQPDGSIATEFAAEPQWVPDEAGKWVDADPTVEVAPDGTLSTAATVSDLEFGSAGDTAFVTATSTDGEQVSLTWAEPLPEPLVEGSTVTYPEVLSQVDLEVYAGTAGFSYALVVKSPDAADSAELERVELGMEVEGLTVDADTASDTALLTDAEGEVAYSVAQPWMWDSSETASSGPEQAAPMDLEIDADSLTVVPDQEILADPETEYPVYIDPEFIDSSIGWENAWSQGTGVTCGNNEMCAGRQTWQYDGAYGYWRTGMQFNNMQTLANRDVQQATVWLTQTHTGDAGGPNQTVRLYAMDYFDTNANISWNAFSDRLIGLVATDSVPTSNTGAGEPDQTIEWADSRTATRIQSIVDGASGTASFAVVSGANTDQEDNQNYWRKMDPDSARLKVWHAALKPTSLKTNGAQCSTSAPGPTINTLTPTLTAKAPAALEPTNTLKFYVYNRNEVPDNHLRKIEVAGVSENETVTVTVPSGTLERGKTYRWNSRVEDADAGSTRHGDFTSYCYFTVNSTPNVPTGLSTADAGCGTQTSPTIVTSTTPKLASIPSDPDGGNVTAKYEVYLSSGTLHKKWDVVGKSGVIATTTVTAGDGLYKWRVATADAFITGPNSGYCWFKIDTTAPAPPDVVQVTTNPLPGAAVLFEFLGGSDVKGFEYSLDGGAKKSVSASTGQAKVSVTPSTSSIDHILQVWAKDVPPGSTGNTSSPTTYLFTVIEAQPVEAAAAWRFDGDLLDDAADHGLTPYGAAAYGPDRANRTDAAATFDGSGADCLSAGSPVIDTTSSFTLATWVRIDAPKTDGHTILNVTGAVRSNFKLALTAQGQWMFTAASADVNEGYVWVRVTADTPLAEYGEWTHVAAVYDAAAERMRLYVNGDLAGSVAMTFEQWKATGLFTVGCGMTPGGPPFGSTVGAVDEVAIFQSVLTSDQIEELMTGEGLPAALQAWYPLRGDGADHSGRAADLTAMPETPSWREDQHGRASSALDLNGAICPTAETAPVRTDSAFTVSAWARLDADHANSHPRVFTFGGDFAFSVMAKYNAATDKWNVAVTAEDTAVPDWGEGAVSTQVASEEEWTQIAVTADTDNNIIQLFVNGQLSDTGAISTTWDTWRASEFVIGCGSLSDGTRTSQWDGAISDVRVWRGALDAAEVAATHAERISHWELDKNPAIQGTDQWGANDLTFHGSVGWETDRWDDCWAAYGLDLTGTGYASTTTSVVRTDESFSVSAWAKIDDNNDHRVVASQITDQDASFYLAYYANTDRWQFALKGMDPSGPVWETVEADEATEVGRWYHLAATYDLGRGEISLYVDGVLQNVADGPEHPWHGDGQLLLGATGNTAGERWSHMAGSIDQVYAWTGVIDPHRIRTYAAEHPKPQQDTSKPECSGTTPPDIPD